MLEIQKELQCVRVPVINEDFGTGRCANIRRRVWDLFEKPDTSWEAKVCSMTKITDNAIL